MRKMRLMFVSTLTFCVASLLGYFQPIHGFAQQRTATATIRFRVVSADDFRVLPGARVIVVGEDGRIITSGVTNTDGIWSPSLTVPLDPRFKDIGIVTAIGVANEHNENVVFEVPVKQGTVQPITLYPIQPRLRNEASASLGQLHHLDVIEIVNRYAQMLGLSKQPGIVGEFGYSPWSPNLKSRR
ncbi:hypothetical protein [Alicyclobacillus mengziensis]|uniref:Bacterial Ig domain-containing protein n=1 Tax=Alicyclobacillus mengziensis TaxID=2931921 RepID=A0A9X7VUR8_9BACL|nr:hypothetical protein [Alicyclobacillus mengziensis]QSO45476.1 hypothetical protein JZ786_12915 [Alicyclobacillus mengziensis]